MTIPPAGPARFRVRRRLTMTMPMLATSVVALVASACGSTAPTQSAVTTIPASGSSVPTSALATTTTVEGSRRSAGCDKSTGTTPPAGDPASATIDVEGTERTYLVSAAGIDTAKPAPVVVLLHGMGSTAADINRVSDLPARAAAEATIVVTLQAVGTPTLWRAAAQGPDAQFVDAVLAEVEATRCIDLARIHVAGFSVGAALASAYACARQDRIASIVTVTVEAPGGCAAPMPILSFHGTTDPVIAYGNFDPAAGPITGTEANMAVWAETGGCQRTPTVTEVGTEVTRLEWPNCAADAEVVLYRVIGGGHDWPGKDPATAVMPSTQQVSATNEALAFFARHHT